MCISKGLDRITIPKTEHGGTWGRPQAQHVYSRYTTCPIYRLNVQSDSCRHFCEHMRSHLGQLYAPALQRPLKVNVWFAVRLDGRLRLPVHIPKLHHEAHHRLHELLFRHSSLSRKFLWQTPKIAAHGHAHKLEPIRSNRTSLRTCTDKKHCDGRDQLLDMHGFETLQSIWAGQT